MTDGALAHFGPLRRFTLASSEQPNHPSRRALSSVNCAGATPPPATPMYWPHNDENAPSSAQTARSLPQQNVLLGLRVARRNGQPGHSRCATEAMSRTDR